VESTHKQTIVATIPYPLTPRDTPTSTTHEQQQHQKRRDLAPKALEEAEGGRDRMASKVRSRAQ
jgi:hypothetical protein